MSIFLCIILALISFFPIVIWAYNFAFITDNPLNKKRFIFGVIGGILSVFPILHLHSIIDFFGDFQIFNVFFIASNIQGFFSSLEFFVSLSLILTIIISFSLIIGSFVFRQKGATMLYLKNFITFLGFIFLLSLFLLGSNLVLQQIDFTIPDKVMFGSVVFDTFRLIVFYYIIVAFVEEASKYFNFLQSSGLKIGTIKTGVESAIFVALGFSFVENILYLSNFLGNQSANFDFVKLYFFRSVFSVIVHVLCSSIVAYYFSKSVILYREKSLSFPYLKIFLFGLVIAIFLHTVFDVALSLGFSLVLFIYFIGGYLYISSIFYKDEKI